MLGGVGGGGQGSPYRSYPDCAASPVREMRGPRIMTWLLNNEIHSKAVCDFIAGSIELASSQVPAKWGLTEYKAGGLRLNVGFCEVITTRRNELRVLLDASVSSKTPDDIQFKFQGTISEPFYRSTPKSQLLTLPYLEDAELGTVLAAIRESHEAIVRTAATRGFNYGAKRGHSNQAVEVLSELIGRELPYPGYAVPESVTRPLPEELPAETPSYLEGSRRRVVVNRYERDLSARRRCLEVRGTVCDVCRIDLATVYGPKAEGLVHVHHLVPLAEVGDSYEVDPERDLVPVCPNCHAVIHLDRDKPLTPLEVRKMIDRASRSTAQNAEKVPDTSLRQAAL